LEERKPREGRAMPYSTAGVAESHLLQKIRKYRGPTAADTTNTLRLGNMCRAEMHAMGTDAAWKAAWITGGISTGGYAEYVRMDDAARARIDAFLDSKEGNNGMQRVAVESENMLSFHTHCTRSTLAIHCDVGSAFMTCLVIIL
jgi:hypothetical protein